MPKQIWIVTGESESGDDYGPTPFDHAPNEEELARWAHECDGHFNDPEEMKDWENGPGYAGSYVHVTVTPKEA